MLGTEIRYFVSTHYSIPLLKWWANYGP